jgi:hypothetical protein
MNIRKNERLNRIGFLFFTLLMATFLMPRVAYSIEKILPLGDEFAAVLEEKEELEKISSEGSNDFLLYALKFYSIQLAVVYVGTAPRFPNSSELTNAKVEIERRGPFTIKSIRNNHDIWFGKEVLVFPTKQAYGPYIHIAYHDLARSEADRVDEFINSLRFK